MKPTLAALLFLLAACSAPGRPAAQPTPSIHDRAVAAWHRVIQCAHDHGYDIPDPSIDDQGNATFPDSVQKPPDSVIQACQQYLNQVPNVNQGGGGPSAADIRDSHKLAQCLRAHGEPNFPDPNADGTFPLTPAVEGEGKSPTMIAAMQACAQYMHSGHIWFTPVNG
ncbi:MAG TPA: hypothetical protein VF160_02565 [Candidatus Dormibacteraeota bacterium]